MEEYEVRDMVHREAKPDLLVEAGSLSCSGTQGIRHLMHLPFYLYNSGRGAARWPVVTIYVHETFEGIIAKPSSSLLSFLSGPELEGETRRSFQFYGDTVVIPPGARVPICHIKFWAPPQQNADLEMQCSLHAESALPKDQSLRISWEKIKLAIDQFVPSK